MIEEPPDEEKLDGAPTLCAIALIALGLVAVGILAAIRWIISL
jgi:hypothetical protein